MKRRINFFRLALEYDLFAYTFSLGYPHKNKLEGVKSGSLVGQLTFDRFETKHCN